MTLMLWQLQGDDDNLDRPKGFLSFQAEISTNHRGERHIAAITPHQYNLDVIKAPGR